MLFMPDDASFRVGGNMRALSYSDLNTKKGIRFSRQWIRDLVNRGLFPAPFNLGQQSVAFVEEEIDEWLASRIRERDKKPLSNTRITSKIEIPSDGCIDQTQKVDASGSDLNPSKTEIEGSRGRRRYVEGRMSGRHKVKRDVTP
jgi:prophage regulatory protein